MSQKINLYEQAQRRLVSSLMYDASRANEILDIVSSEHIEDPALELIFKNMTDLSLRNEEISPVSVATLLEQSGDLDKVGGVAELFALHTEGRKYALEAPIELYANLVRDTGTKNKAVALLDESKTHFKDDSGMNTVEAVSSLQSSLNELLVGLSDNSTVTTLKDSASKYSETLAERRRISEENKDNDGLQGIPSLLPTLNKYTHGWTSSQMITCGAKTGVGKALALDTPLLTSNGWSTMGDVQIGDYVYGRDGELTQVTNVTDVQLDRKTYAVNFDNGETIVADRDHLWLTREFGAVSEEVRTTQEIFESQYIYDNEENIFMNHYVKASQVLANDENTNVEEAATIQKWIENPDSAPAEKVIEALNDYLLASIDQRENLMRTLLGEEERGTVYYSDYDLTMFITSLLASLGYAFDVSDDYDAYRIVYSKVSQHVIGISSVEEVDSVPVKCIEVDNEDHVYLAGRSLIPTHNSVFAVNSAVAAARAGKSVLFFTLEMQNQEIDDRIIACMSGVSLQKLKEGNLTDEEQVLVDKALAELDDMNIIVDSDPNVTVDSIRARAFREAQSPTGLDLVIVDYLQLITPVGKFASRQEAVANISRSIKLTAKTLKIPIMVLVQLNRSNDDDDDEKLPNLEGIRESAAIAMDSDVVILLHRDQTFEDTTPHTLVILAKNRGGEKDKIIRCHSNLESSLFREVKKEQDVVNERMTDEEYAELEDDLDLDDFDDNLEYED